MVMQAVPPSEAVIEIRGLTRSFGAKRALHDIDLVVPRGSVFGLVGENGSGKTTLIKHIVGLLRAQTGSVRVFGRDPVADPVGVLSRVGYLAEDVDLPAWMRVDELMRYTQAFYRDWDPGYAEELRRQFGLDPAARIKHLSKGQQARAGLLVALAHRPELLVLDEPASGLDPVVRRDILEAVVRTVAVEGRTVLFSSHLLDDLERVADHVAMIRGGKVALCGTLDTVKELHHQVTLRFEEPCPRPPVLAGALAWRGGGHEWTAVCRGRLDDLHDGAAAVGALVVDSRAVSLDDIFVAEVSHRPTASEVR
jgi:ABC-2 type transport system ATP-binding protein